jgi:hypothetical protein
MDQRQFVEQQGKGKPHNHHPVDVEAAQQPIGP